MKSVTTAQFWKLYHALPEDVQRRADKAYALWQVNPQAHGLYFKSVGIQQPVHSVRIGTGHRALGLLTSDTMLWFWIGPHDEYVGLIRHLQLKEHAVTMPLKLDAHLCRAVVAAAPARLTAAMFSWPTVQHCSTSLLRAMQRHPPGSMR